MEGPDTEMDYCEFCGSRRVLQYQLGSWHMCHVYECGTASQFRIVKRKLRWDGSRQDLACRAKEQKGP